MVHLAQCACFIKTGNSEKKEDAILWISAQELLLSSSSSIVSGGFVIPSCIQVYVEVFQYTLLSRGGGPVLHFTIDPDSHVYALCLRIEAELNLCFVTLNFNQDGPKPDKL